MSAMLASEFVILLIYQLMESTGMMPEPMKAKLKHLIVAHEGYKRFPYMDTEGKITIGIGYNLTDRGLPDSWINDQYDRDVEYFYSQLASDFPWFKELNEARQIALVDMCFMGYKSFKSFKRMLSVLAEHDYKLASFEMISSKWATQVKGRASQLAQIMLTGEL